MFMFVFYIFFVTAGIFLDVICRYDLLFYCSLLTEIVVVNSKKINAVKSVEVNKCIIQSFLHFFDVIFITGIAGMILSLLKIIFYSDCVHSLVFPDLDYVDIL